MIILSICVSPLHDIHPRIPEASPLRNETHRRLLRLKRFTYTINLDHYRSLLGTNSPGFDGARLLRTKREGSCTNKILGGSSHLNKLVTT